MKNINIVIVEENPINRIKMEIFITDFISDKYSFKIVNEFEDLESLLAYLEDHEVDVILSDIFFDKKPLGIEILKK